MCFFALKKKINFCLKMADSFESWLNLLLRELNTDETVFCSYITGILEGDESLEEKSEALEGILSEIIVSQKKKFCFPK